jgi:hypothetical protein
VLVWKTRGGVPAKPVEAVSLNVPESANAVFTGCADNMFWTGAFTMGLSPEVFALVTVKMFTN